MSLRQQFFSIFGANPITSQLLLSAYRHKYRREFRASFTDPTLEYVRDSGYHIIRDFVPRDTCAEYAEEVENVFGAHPEVVHQPRVEQADMRIFGIESLSPACAAFAGDTRIKNWVESYTDDAGFMFTMANIIDTPNDYGSGGMWHRDGFLPELKCILYLTDVTIENGPFRLISKSHAMGHHHRRDMRRYGMNFLQNRLGDVAERVVENEPERLITAVGHAGTLILFDTSVIHTGAPLRSGKRIALTNYHTRRESITDRLRDHYAPVVMGKNAYWKDGRVHPFS